MYCPRCGEQLADGAGFCIRCGLPLFGFQGDTGSRPPPQQLQGQPKLLLGPGGHWYLNGVPLDPNGRPQFGLPAPDLNLAREHVIDIDSQEIDVSDAPERKSATLGYLSEQWAEGDDDDDTLVPIQGMIGETFDRLRPKDDFLPPAETRIQKELTDAAPIHQMNDRYSGFGDENEPRVDPFFSKFTDRTEDDRVASIPYYPLRFIAAILGVLGVLLMIILCVRLGTFHMIYRMTFDGMRGKALLAVIPVLLVGACSGFASRQSETAALISAYCYLVVAAISYFCMETYPVLKMFLAAFGVSTIIDILHFLVRFADDGNSKK